MFVFLYGQISKYPKLFAKFFVVSAVVDDDNDDVTQLIHEKKTRTE